MKSELKKATRRKRSQRSRGTRLDDYLCGLRQIEKKLSCKLLYDDEGARLFDQICLLQEYYPTRTELAILRDNVGEIGRRAGEGVILVELGSGSGAKGRMLLQHLRKPEIYIPVEIAREQLDRSCNEIQADFPDLTILSMCTDYTNDLRLPAFSADRHRILLFFPGSTVGNFEPIEAVGFLLKLARLGGKGTGLLIGIDLKKDRHLLEAAYNDSSGVTAAFNLNILARANRDFAANFNLEAFQHRAFYDPFHGRIVMQLESRCSQEVRIGFETFRFAEGERITTEYSYKYSIDEFRALARLAGFSPEAVWTDSQQLFSLHYLTVA